MKKKEDDKKINKKPLYKIGDLVVSKDRYGCEDNSINLTQSKIIHANAILELGVGDTLSWYYITEATLEDGEDCLTESEILYKL